MTAPLAYLILASDDVDDLRGGRQAACWALKATHVVDVAETLPEAKAEAARAARAAGRAMSILSVRLVDDEETGAEL